MHFKSIHQRESCVFIYTGGLFMYMGLLKLTKISPPSTIGGGAWFIACSFFFYFVPWVSGIWVSVGNFRSQVVEGFLELYIMFFLFTLEYEKRTNTLHAGFFIIMSNTKIRIFSTYSSKPQIFIPFKPWTRCIPMHFPYNNAWRYNYLTS